MNNIQKVRKQIAINICIMSVSILVIYIGLCIEHGFYNLNWKDGLNAELIFVMISSLGSVVGWRIVEGIKKSFGYNLLLIMIGGAFCIEYGAALVVNNEALKFIILISCILLLFFYISEQLALIFNAAKSEPKKKSNSLKYGERGT